MTSSGDAAKRETELDTIRRWIERTGTCAGATVEQCQFDPPDFELHHEGHRIAVEMVRVYIDGPGPSLLKRGVTLRDGVCLKLEEMLPKLGVRPLVVTLTFAHDQLSERVGVLADKIARLIVAHDPTDDALLDLDARDWYARPEWGREWPEDLHSLMLLRPTGWDTKTEVTQGDAGFEMFDCVLPLTQAIAKKEPDLGGYRARYNAAWLLIVAEGNEAASFMCPDDRTREHMYTSEFDRVFFFRNVFHDAFELRLAEQCRARVEDTDLGAAV